MSGGLKAGGGFVSPNDSVNLHLELADSLGLHPDSIQLDEPLEVAYRYGRIRAAEEVRAARLELARAFAELASARLTDRDDRAGLSYAAELVGDETWPTAPDGPGR